MKYTDRLAAEGEYPQSREQFVNIEIWDDSNPPERIGFGKMNISIEHKNGVEIFKTKMKELAAELI